VGLFTGTAFLGTFSAVGKSTSTAGANTGKVGRVNNNKEELSQSLCKYRQGINKAITKEY